MLPLTFADTADYDKIRPDDRVALLGLKQLAPGSVRKCSLKEVMLTQ